MRNLYLGRIDEENEKGAGRYKNVIIQHQENERLEELLDQYDCQLLNHGVQPSPTEYRIYCVDEDLEKMSRFLIQNYGMRTGESAESKVDEMLTSFVALCAPGRLPSHFQRWMGGLHEPPLRKHIDRNKWLQPNRRRQRRRLVKHPRSRYSLGTPLAEMVLLDRKTLGNRWKPPNRASCEISDSSNLSGSRCH